MNKTILNGRFLILSKNEINEIFMNETEYSYRIMQIEHGFNDDYIVEVIEKGPRVNTEPTLDNIVKNMCGDKV